MPIDTSTYYPEVPSGDDNDYSLNRRNGDLFGSRPEPPGDDDKGETEKKEEQPKESPAHIEPSSAEKFVTAISSVLSVVLLPLFMPVYGLIFAFGLSILDIAPMGMRMAFTLIVAAIDIVLPMTLILIMKKMGIINDVGLNNRQERFIPYLITALCFGGTAWFMAVKGAPLWLSLFFAGGALATLVNTVINFWWKISAHAAGIAGVVALLIRIERDGSPEPELMFWLVLTIALAGLLGSARIWLGRHTVWQVLAGFVVGFCSVFFLI